MRFCFDGLTNCDLFRSVKKWLGALRMRWAAPLIAVTLSWCLPCSAVAQGVPIAITIDASHPGPTIDREQFGVNQPVFADSTRPEIVRALAQIGVGLLRWPGGSGDVYHWAKNANGPGYCSTYAGVTDPHNTFDAFITKVAQPLGAAVAVQVNYGSDATCTAGADPAEAAAWVAYARHKNYGIRLWSIGNEQWADFAVDLHVTTHDPWRYSWEVAHSYYPRMKGADPSIQIGIDVAGKDDPRWDSIVLKYAKYDFVDLHVYPENSPHDDDRLLHEGPQNVAAAITQMREALRVAGHPSIPIFVGEWNSVAYDLGKQATSIVEALFVGMTQAQMLDMGVPYAAFFDGFETSCGTAPADDRLYGALPFGTWSLFSAGSQTDREPGTCPQLRSFPPRGTPYPAAQAFAMVRRFGHPGQSMVRVSVSPAQREIVAYGATDSSGYRLLLFNLDRDRPMQVEVGTGGAAAAFDVATETYGKAQYDLSGAGTLARPVTDPAVLRRGVFPLTLAPWSMTLVSMLAR